VDIEAFMEGYSKTIRNVTVIGASHQSIVLRLEKSSVAPPLTPSMPLQPSMATLVQGGGETDNRASQTSKWVWIGLGAIVVIVGAIAGVAVLSSNSDPSPGQISEIR
jgi:hypothetical protein